MPRMSFSPADLAAPAAGAASSDQDVLERGDPDRGRAVREAL